MIRNPFRYARRREDKQAIAYGVAVFIGVLLLFYAVFAKAQLYCSSDDCGSEPPKHKHHHHHHKSSDRSIAVPVFALGVGAGVGATVWWLGRSKEAPPEPKAQEMQERVLTITPDVRVYQ